MKFTILGSTGFIGRNLVSHLTSKGHEVYLPPRDTASFADHPDLGHVIYSIGLTGNNRQKPYETIDAHVTLLIKLLSTAKFESWTYLSSTRLYGGIPAGAVVDEQTPITLVPNGDSIFDVSKMLGEAVCDRLNLPQVRSLRLSNVYGLGQSTHTFLGSVLDTLKNTGEVTIQEGASSSKDYIAIQDVVRLVEAVAMGGKQSLYNISSGIPVTHEAIASALNNLGKGLKVNINPQGLTRAFPIISNNRIATEFGFKPRDFLSDLAALANHWCQPDVRV